MAVEEVLHVMTPAEWGQPIPVDEKWVDFVDDNVRAKLSSDVEIEDISPHGASHWTRTAKISTATERGSSPSFFLKVSQGDTGWGMVSGEYASMTALYKALPQFVARPLGCGTYASNPDIHFFLCEIVNMTEHVPEIRVFTKSLADLHHKTVSPNGKYGFHVPTYKEEKSQGPDNEVQQLCQGIFDKVIPRLLRPLETGGRQIQPGLIHGDLWAGNASTNVDTNLPVVFDGACLYAHNEMEMAAWRPIRHVLGREYMKAYFEYFEPSEPKEDQVDRNMLYYLRWDLKSSALFPGVLRYRNMAKETMKTLIAKFPEGYEGWAKAKREEPVQRVIPPTPAPTI